MKKYIVAAVVALLLGGVCALAQPRAIGIRTLGMLSYEHTFGGVNFLEAEIGAGYGGLMLEGVYNWMLVESVGDVSNLNLYAGPGLALGVWQNAFSAGLSAQLGLEYSFDAIPIQLSLDIRPKFGFNGSTFWTTGLTYGLVPHLGIRYLF